MDRQGASPSSIDREFTYRGWILVGGILCAFLLIPFLIAYRPPTFLSYRFAYLILPAVPAIGLAVLAVWATTRP